MRTNIRVNLVKNKSSVTNFSTVVELPDNSTVLDLKSKLKSDTGTLYDFEKGVIYKKHKELKDTDLVSSDDQLWFELEIE